MAMFVIFLFAAFIHIYSKTYYFNAPVGSRNNIIALRSGMSSVSSSMRGVRGAPRRSPPGTCIYRHIFSVKIFDSHRLKQNPMNPQQYRFIDRPRTLWRRSTHDRVIERGLELRASTNPCGQCFCLHFCPKTNAQYSNSTRLYKHPYMSPSTCLLIEGIWCSHAPVNVVLSK